MSDTQAMTAAEAVNWEETARLCLLALGVIATGPFTPQQRIAALAISDAAKIPKIAAQNPPPGQVALVEKVKYLLDWKTWTWTQMMSLQGAARLSLVTLADLGLIRHFPHPSGGDVWLVGDEAFGRLDGVDIAALAATPNAKGKK